MASALRADYFVSVEDYLAGERISQQKHEYLAGVIYAMAGTTINHDRIANNIIAELHTQLRGKPCEVFSSDVKVRIQRDAANFFTIRMPRLTVPKPRVRRFTPRSPG